MDEVPGGGFSEHKAEGESTEANASPEQRVGAWHVYIDQTSPRPAVGWLTVLSAAGLESHSIPGVNNTVLYSPQARKLENWWEGVGDIWGEQEARGKQSHRLKDAQSVLYGMKEVRIYTQIWAVQFKCSF